MVRERGDLEANDERLENIYRSTLSSLKEEQTACTSIIETAAQWLEITGNDVVCDAELAFQSSPLTTLHCILSTHLKLKTE